MNLNNQKKINNNNKKNYWREFLKLADVNSCSPKVDLKGEDKECL